MHSTEGVHPPLQCFSQMLLFGGEGMFDNPPPQTPGLYHVRQGVSPVLGCFTFQTLQLKADLCSKLSCKKWTCLHTLQPHLALF